MTSEELLTHIDTVMKDYQGSVHDLYGAIGVMAVGEGVIEVVKI